MNGKPGWSAVQLYQQQITECKGHMRTSSSSLILRVLTALRKNAMLFVPLLALMTIEIPAHASTMNGTVAAPAGLIPTGVGLAFLLALRRQKKTQL